MSLLFSPVALRSVTIPNRVFVSPMCQYSCEDGMPNDWHLVHLGSRAVGGTGLVFTEAASVSPDGRITPWDAGIWSAQHAAAWKPIAAFIKAQGVVPGIQLAHAGRKASCDKPWNGGGPLARDAGGWKTHGPSDVAFGNYPAPRAMSAPDLEACVADFRLAADRALQAGFEVAEVHAAHGYLLHEFLSPLSNLRKDDFGGSLSNRMRFPLAVVRAVRDAWPQDKPVLVRISASDWKEGGWDLEQSIAFARELKELGVDMIDVSSGGNAADQKVVLGPGYQAPFAAAIRRDAGIATAAVGLITEPVQAEHILATGQADAVCLARALLRDPYWARHAARALDEAMPWPNQYKRADVGPLGR
ncbi:MAG TPA: NADH:flavin oxidoreductase/NADH oxidase [Usitatibacteraceae bacterium]|nr:NADH:flavin oxidoreductase/NADH oxidase [Usitatibacteraceae bacterium]